jgi:hypothetical protein
MDRLINWDIAGNPLNWLIVSLMMGAGAVIVFALMPAMKEFAGPARVL